MDEALEDVVIARRLRWLGHVARMQEDRIPKRLLFGWLTHPRPMHGYKLRWRDRIRKILRGSRLTKEDGIEMQRREVYGEHNVEKV